MMKYTEIGGGVCAAKGFSAGGVHAGFRKNTAKLDLAMVVADDICTAAGVFTKNKVFAAPVGVTKAHLSAGHARLSQTAATPTHVRRMATRPPEKRVTWWRPYSVFPQRK